MGSCANCKQSASNPCSGCYNAPKYQSSDVTATFYCRSECQAEHWTNHKVFCKKMKQRKALLRSAILSKEALLAYKTVDHDLWFTKFEIGDDTLNLEHDRFQMHRHPFQEYLTDDPRFREAALLINQCQTALSICGPMLRTLLSGNSSIMEAVHVKMCEPPLHVHLEPPGSGPTLFHFIVLVWQDDEEWVIDTSGAQYGIRGVLFPFDEYVRDYRREIVSRQPYTDHETTELDGVERDIRAGRSPIGALRDNEIQKRCRQHFATFVRNNVTRSLRQGTNSEFQVKRDRFRQDVNAHMQSYPPQEYYPW